MKIVSAEFEKSAYSRLHYPNAGLPEVAFLGRSNVGKSSLLNSLLQRRRLARTSNTPGRTQSINFAKVSKKMRAGWGKMAGEYLSARDELVLSIQLVDSRHEPSPLDRQLNEWLHFHDLMHIVVATKADKLSRSELGKQLIAISKMLPESPILPYSSETGHGREELWAGIAGAVEKS
jgi:GTP-binding protein